MSRLLLFCFFLFFVVLPSAVLAQVTAEPAVKKSRQVSPSKAESAAWTQELGDAVGLTYKQFMFLGLSKLTRDEFLRFVSWAGTAELQARQRGVDAGKEEWLKEPPLMTYSCGPFLDGVAASKVNLFIDASGGSVSEITSEFRQKLRSISDVRIVYSLKDADLVLGILSYELRTKGDTLTGYAASVMVSTPCKGKLGSNEWDFFITENNILETGGKDVKPLVGDIVASIDAKNFEGVRSQHSSYLKYINEQKKSGPASK
jgi:hypothetical protein